MQLAQDEDDILVAQGKGSLLGNIRAGIESFYNKAKEVLPGAIVIDKIQNYLDPDMH